MPKKSKYYSLSNDFSKLRHGSGAGEKTFAGVKIAAKSVFNITKFTCTEFIPAMAAAAEKKVQEAEKNKK